MQPRVFPPLVEAFLILDQPRQRLSHWVQALALLDDGRAPPVAMVSAHFDPTADQALLGLRYDELALGGERLSFVIEIALLAEIGMIQPSELSEGDRRRFDERLARCTFGVADQRNVTNALTELVRRAREQKPSFRTTTPHLLPKRQPPPVPPEPMRASARATTNPRGTTDDPVLLVHAKSTRDLALDDDPILELETEIPHAKAPELARTSSEDVTHAVRQVITEPVPLVTPRRDVVARTLSPNIIPRSTALRAPSPDAGLRGPSEPSVHHKDTVQLDPAESQRMASADISPHLSPMASANGSSPLPAAVTRNLSPNEPYLPTEPAPPPEVIYARYLRSGRWVPIRIGALSLKGAALMAGALPRLHDHVDIALSFAGHRALVRGPVNKVSSQEEVAQSGAASFSVKFELDDAAHRGLTALLTAARAASVTIKPPPPRGNRRYPVEWPVCLGTTRGAIRAEALDISRQGMFVRPANALTLDSSLNFSAVLDDGAGPVSGRAGVVRHITEGEARTCGLSHGYGLQIREMSPSDLERWTQFLLRVELRAEKRVLIGASPGRLNELQAGLAAAGYAVTGGTDPGALVQLASTETRPVDACLIDAGWLSPSMSATWVESLFSARNVPCVTMRGDVRRARAAIDKLLLVV